MVPHSDIVMISDSVVVVLALSLLEMVPRSVSVIVEDLVIGSFVCPAIGLVVISVATCSDIKVPGTTT